MTDLARLQQIAARFAPVSVQFDPTALPGSERRALDALAEAARIIDALYLRQVWAGNETMLQTLAREATAAASGPAATLATARLHAFLINKGPWDRLDANRPFVHGVGPKPEGANFYPVDATREEIGAWFDQLPEPAQTHARGFHTAVRRHGRQLVAVPYSVEYAQELGLAAACLRRGADATADATLRRFLTARADAFLSNDYYESDVAWMELDSLVEPTIGPYEVYEDEWFNLKAAFEAFLTVRDDEETRKLQVFGRYLQDIEDHLPVDPRYLNPRLAALSPIRVVNEVLAAGEANRGVRTAAFNLPNDERVLREKGAKRVMLKNVQEAKFRMVLAPIAAVALRPDARRLLSFGAFFTHILMHELMHGLGPHDISLNGRSTTVRQELGNAYSAIEEAKADISALWALRFLADTGRLDPALARSAYTTFLASIFRSIRFGIEEAHGRGVAIQINWLLDRGGVVVREDGTFEVDEARISEAVESLTREILTLQAEGNEARARDLIAELGVVRPDVKRVLDRLDGVPVDIEIQTVATDPGRQVAGAGC